MHLESTIRTVSDFPKPGIMFKDITTMLKDPAAFRECIDRFEQMYRGKGVQKVVAIESRGFIIGAALADRLGAGFVPVRKPGKLPAAVLREEYALEYGTDAIEIHTDAVLKGEKVLLHDDVLATGGTMKAASSLVERLGGEIVGLSFIIELAFLSPRTKLPGYDIRSLITYDAE